MRDDKKNPRDDQQDEDFPGYPHYPAKEDIMSPSSDMKRVEVDVENLTPSGKFLNTKDNPAGPPSAEPASFTAAAGDDELDIVKGTEADVTRDDLIALGGTKFSEDDLHTTARTS